jgi:O-methyltransferase involved in polyketide biosynthesis
VDDQDRPEIDTSVPHEARMYDYWLGGKDNFPPDRALGDLIRERIPTISAMARANRAFLDRAVRYLAGEAGIRQFLDIGTGIPTAPNVHQVAQAVDPSTRVLYVDNDPLVLAHARALMASTPEGRTAFVLGDFRDPDAILGSDEFAAVLDRGQPIALMLVAMLMYFDPDEENGVDPYPIVRQVVDMLPSGSHLALTHPTGDFDAEAMEGVRAVSRQAGITIRPRSKDEVARFLDGLEVVDPGIAPVLAWRPDAQDTGDVDPHSAYYWAAVARKP